MSAASAQLYKDIPGFSSRYGGAGSLFASTARARHGAGADAGTAADELEPYRSLYPARGDRPGSEKENRRARASTEKGKGVDRDAELVKALREVTELEDVASLDKRWTAGWTVPVLSRYVGPSRSFCQAALTCSLASALQGAPPRPDATASQALEALSRLHTHPNQA